MPLQTERYVFADEIERLTGAMEETAEQQAEWPEDSAQAQTYTQQGVQYETMINGLQWASEQWDADGVVLSGLTPGELNLAGDIADEHGAYRQRDVEVAVATRDAPYLQHTPDDVLSPQEEQAVKETVRTITGEVAMPFVFWAEERIADLSYMGVDAGNGYRALVNERLDNSSES